MIQIADNSFYKLTFDPQKNRAYLTLTGYWSNVEDVKDYLLHLQQLTDLTDASYTMLVDAHRMLLHPPQVQRLLVEAQQLCLKNGILAVAEICSNDLQADLQLDSIARKSGIYTNKFLSKAEAEEWLEEQVELHQQGIRTHHK